MSAFIHRMRLAIHRRTSKTYMNSSVRQCYGILNSSLIRPGHQAIEFWPRQYTPE